MATDFLSLVITQYGKKLVGDS